MILYLQQCINNMNSEERRLYQESTATNLFEHLHNSEKFQTILAKMVPNEEISEEEWTYLFEKLYLVTYKAMSEESSPKLLDALMYLISRLGTKLYPKHSFEYNDSYKNFEIIRSIYRSKKVNVYLLEALATTMNSRKPEDFATLLKMHKEASLMRNHCVFMYQETLKSNDGELTVGEITAINCFNRSYEKEKRLVLEYKK